MLSAYSVHWRLRDAPGPSVLAAGYGTVQAIADCIYDGVHSALVVAPRENVRAHLEKLKADRRTVVEAGRWTT